MPGAGQDIKAAGRRHGMVFGMRPGLAATAFFVVACGHSSTAPEPVPTPTPRPVNRFPVAGIVYYDENANGLVDDSERVHLPRVSVGIGDRLATSGADGRFLVDDAAEGTTTATAQVDSLPPFFTSVTVTGVPVPAPSGFLLALPVTLPIERMRPNLYMAFGDSITVGDGSRGGGGYRSELEALLRGYWGAGRVVNEGVTSTRSDQGADRIGASLSRVQPAYTVIHYGTNDWNSLSCRYVPSCHTVSSLRSMIGSARSVGSVPVVGTVIPANPAYADRMAYERNAWLVETNDRIRVMVKEEGAVLADLHAGFMAKAGNDLETLFADHIHPNDDGYEVMAAEFFRAITSPRGAAK